MGIITTHAESIVRTTADYRAGEIPAPTVDHVKKWLKQFPEDVREGLIAEMDHVLKKLYISKPEVVQFLTRLVRNEKLVGAGGPEAFWKAVELLEVQGGGNSQRDMLKIFRGILRSELGIEKADIHPSGKVFIYLDDILFSGNRIRHDMENWLENAAPAKAEVHIIVMALHTKGSWYVNDKLKKKAAEVKKDVKFHCWRLFELESDDYNIDDTDVLRTTGVPDGHAVEKYAEEVNAKYTLAIRKRGGKSKVFASEDGRGILEDEFLKAGVHIRSICPNLKPNHRPLGYSVLHNLGFGALAMTYRNCPNNCPLAFWAGDPWYPLFERKNN